MKYLEGIFTYFNRYLQLVAFLAGILIFIFPLVSFILFVSLGVVNFGKSKHPMELLIVSWSIFRFFSLWWTSGSLLLGITEAVVLFFVYFSLRNDQKINKIIIKMSLISLIIVLIISYTQSIFPTSSPKWFISPNVVKYEEIDNYFRYSPINLKNSWISFDLSLKGPGIVSISWKSRSTQRIYITTFINETTSGNSWKQTILPKCFIDTSWNVCRMQYNLKNRGFISANVGGNNSWKLGMPSIDIKDFQYRINGTPSLFEILKPSIRTKGFSGNENVFGAQIALISLLAMNSRLDKIWYLLSIFAGIFGIFLSGSREALVAYAIGIFILYTSKKTMRRYIVPLVIFAMITITFFVFKIARNNDPIVYSSSPPIIRIFNIFQYDSIRNRMEIWRLVFKAWLNNSHSVILGSRNLPFAIRNAFDARSANFNLQNKELTHSHNLWLQTVGESGLLGLTCILTLWYFIIYRIFSLKILINLVLITVIFVVNLTDYLLYYPIIYVFFLISMSKIGVESNIRT